MKQRILAALAQLEPREGVAVLYACESGSRAWGFPSRDSDYDVRFLYLHPPEWYLSMAAPRDVIEYPVDDRLDLSGWDLRKALHLFRKSNPPLLEWLRSPLVYLERGALADRLRQLLPAWFSPRNALYHYLHMADGNYREYLRRDPVRIKKYFYVLRPLLACRWIESRNSMPPMEFPALVETQSPVGPVRAEIENLLARKLAGEEFALEPRVAALNDFIEEQLRHFQAFAPAAPVGAGAPDLDRIFLEALLEVWGPTLGVTR